MTDHIRQLRERAGLWRSRLEAGDLTERQKKEFDEWMATPVHARAFAEAELLWHTLGKAELACSDAPELPDPRMLLNAPSRTAANSEAPVVPMVAAPASRRSFVWGISAVAAVIALGVWFQPWRGVATPSPASTASYQTAVAEVRTFTLGDGTSLSLGAASRVDVTFTEDQRQADLVAGEALFEVSTDPRRDFLVRSGAALVRVTGTVFDAKRAGDSLRVGVLEGSVEVFHPRATEIFAAPDSTWEPRGGEPLEMVRLAVGDQVTVSREAGLGRPAQAPLRDLGAWRDGRLVFFRARLGDLAADVERYSTTILGISPDVADLRVTATFDTADLMSEPVQALRVLEAALPVQVTRLADSSLLISRRPASEEKNI